MVGPLRGPDKTNKRNVYKKHPYIGITCHFTQSMLTTVDDDGEYPGDVGCMACTGLHGRRSGALWGL
jgi:hypothetical protein